MNERHKLTAKSHNGEWFVQTSVGEWQKTLAAATGSKRKPYPLPVGHSIFRLPRSRGVAPVTARIEMGAMQQSMPLEVAE